jgi:lipopolysaccharide assembly outer membrane protein LptD (OstA)
MQKTCKKIALTDEHRKKRIEFAQKNHVNMNWDNVIFIDEMVFSSSCHSRKPLWRINGTRYDPNKVLHETRSGRITCGYWGNMTVAGPSELVEVNP